jgi:hypothetical protein
MNRPPPYLAPLLERLADYPLTPGATIEVEFLHDDDCPKLRGGECTCTPDVQLRAEHDPERRPV